MLPALKYAGTVTVSAMTSRSRINRSFRMRARISILPDNAIVSSEFNIVPEWSKTNTENRIWPNCPTPQNVNPTYRAYTSVILQYHCVIALLVLWHLYKMLRERGVGELRQLCNQQAIYSNNPDDGEKPPTPMLLRGYKRDYFGLFMFVLIILCTLGWLVLLAVFVAGITMVLSLVKRMAFFSLKITLPRSVLVIWILMALWVAFLELSRSRLVTYFRIECDPQTAQYIQIREHIEDVIMMYKNSRSLVSDSVV